jgi:hypothetical protein
MKRLADDLGEDVRELLLALAVAPIVIAALWAAMVLTFAFGS